MVGRDLRTGWDEIWCPLIKKIEDLNVHSKQLSFR